MSARNLSTLLETIVVLSLTLAACGGSEGASTEPAGDPAAGQQAFASLTCTGCHGENAEGRIGPKLAGLQEGWEKVQTTVRNGRGGMPQFGTDEVNDKQLTDIYAWLTSLK